MPAPIHLSATKHKADTKSLGMSTSQRLQVLCNVAKQLPANTMSNHNHCHKNFKPDTGQLLKLKREKSILFQEFKYSYLHIQVILA